MKRPYPDPEARTAKAVRQREAVGARASAAAGDA